MQTRRLTPNDQQLARPINLRAPSSKSVDTCRTGHQGQRNYQPLLRRKRSTDDVSTASGSRHTSHRSQQPSNRAKHTHTDIQPPQKLLQKIFDGCDRSTELHAMVKEAIRYLRAKSAVGYLVGSADGWNGLQPGQGCQPTAYLSFAVLHNYALNLKIAYPPQSKLLRLKLLLGHTQPSPSEDSLTRAVSRFVLSSDLEGCFFDLQQVVNSDTLDSSRRLLQKLAMEVAGSRLEQTVGGAHRGQLFPLIVEPRGPRCLEECVDFILWLCERLGSALLHRFEVAVCRAEQLDAEAQEATATLKRFSLPMSMPTPLAAESSKLLVCESRGRLFAFSTVPAAARDSEGLGEILERYMTLVDASTELLSRQRINKEPARGGELVA